MSCRGIRFQMPPNATPDYPANLCPQIASPEGASLGCVAEHSDRRWIEVGRELTNQAFLMARSSRSRAFCMSWSIMTVASLSRSQVTGPLVS